MEEGAADATLNSFTSSRPRLQDWSVRQGAAAAGRGGAGRPPADHGVHGDRGGCWAGVGGWAVVSYLWGAGRRLLEHSNSAEPPWIPPAVLGTSCPLLDRLQNSSSETQRRSQQLAAQVGAHHLDVKIDSIVAAMAALFATITGRVPRFR